MYQNEILQETCDCPVLSKDHQLFPITFKASCKTYGIFGKVTKNFVRITFSLIFPVSISIFKNCGIGAGLN